MAPIKCHCGRDLHYSDKNVKAQVEDIIDRFGPYINITIVDGKTYRVQRHFIALHGIKGKDLANLGFKEVVQ